MTFDWFPAHGRMASNTYHLRLLWDLMHYYTILALLIQSNSFKRHRRQKSLFRFITCFTCCLNFLFTDLLLDKSNVENVLKRQSRSVTTLVILSEPWKEPHWSQAGKQFAEASAEAVNRNSFKSVWSTWSGNCWSPESHNWFCKQEIRKTNFELTSNLWYVITTRVSTYLYLKGSQVGKDRMNDIPLVWQRNYLNIQTDSILLSQCGTGV